MNPNYINTSKKGWCESDPDPKALFQVFWICNNYIYCQDINTRTPTLFICPLQALKTRNVTYSTQKKTLIVLLSQHNNTLSIRISKTNNFFFLKFVFYIFFPQICMYNVFPQYETNKSLCSFYNENQFFRLRKKTKSQWLIDIQ